ncbi:MAG: hypothetical protein HOV94_02130 [Saccharothrix sp.]|nr:hypothetical protein [Saccharothrix sp.]
MPIDPDKLLAHIAGDVRDLGRRVDGIEKAKLPEHLRDLTTTVQALVETVEALQPTDEDEPMPVGYVPNWAVLDRDQAAKVWADLVDWCRTVLHPMYASEIWRPCWYQHPRLRIELTWLWAAWRYSYEPKAPPTRAAEWHTRWWPHLAGVVADELKRCGLASDTLFQPVHPVPARPDDYDEDRHGWILGETDFADDEQLGRWIEADCARRPEPPTD